MEKEKLEGLLIEYIDGNLSADQKQTIEKILAESEEAQRLLKELKEVISLMDSSKSISSLPGHESTFTNNLKAEQVLHHDSKVVPFKPIVFKVAAAVALVLVGVAGGFWINSNYQHQQELASLRKEMSETKHLMMAMLANGQSASQRMQGVNVALTISTADEEVVNALSNAMANDSNTNVRLAALEALGKFVDEPNVRKILIASLSTQDDPIVQIALIQLLVRMKEKSVVNDLEKIINDDNNIEAVKDEAYTGLMKLS